MSEDSSGKTLGIDLGTTNSAMAIWEGEESHVLQNVDGNDLTPSVVYYDDGDVKVGQRANHMASEWPDQTVREIKLEMDNADYEFTVGDNSYTPIDISSAILAKLKHSAEDYLGDDVSEAVITVPAYFNSDQKRNTKRAGEQAGFTEVELTNEPTSAALAYNEEQDDKASGTVLVFDFGGGTLDVSIIDIDPEESQYEVKVAEGNNELGGRDFDRAIMEAVADEIELPDDFDGDPLENTEVEENLRKAAEQAKIELTTNEETKLTSRYLGMVGPNDETVGIDTTLTREDFEDLIEDHLEEIRTTIESAIDSAAVGRSDLDMVLLVGGSTYVPAVRDVVQEATEQEPVRSRDPDEIVAAGAAVYGEKVVVEGGATDAETDDEESGDVTKPEDQITLIEVIPESLGTRLHDDSFDPIIEGNTRQSSARGTEFYTTVKDDQTVVTIEVYQGEDAMAENNTKLSEFRLLGIPQMPAGKPEIEVTFYVDEDGILQVDADELNSDAGLSREVENNITGTKNEDPNGE